MLKPTFKAASKRVRQALERLVDEDAKVRVLHTGSGAVTESDVLLASASEAIVICFATGAEPSAERLADRMGVEIRHYGIIYHLIDDIELALHGMLEPVYTEVVVGRPKSGRSSKAGVARKSPVAACRTAGWYATAQPVSSEAA